MRKIAKVKCKICGEKIEKEDNYQSAENVDIFSEDEDPVIMQDKVVDIPEKKTEEQLQAEQLELEKALKMIE